MLAPAWLPHPMTAGFQKIDIAEQTGQIADWGLSLADGSRVHVHQLSDGRQLVHRDKFDPAHSLQFTAQHLMFETVWGRLAVIAAGAWLLAAVARE
jgi:hypothetical protein